MDRREPADSGSSSPPLAEIRWVETARVEIVSVERIRSAATARRERTRLLRQHRASRTAATRPTEPIRIQALPRLVRRAPEHQALEHLVPELREAPDRARAALSATAQRIR